MGKLAKSAVYQILVLPTVYISGTGTLLIVIDGGQVIMGVLEMIGVMEMMGEE